MRHRKISLIAILFTTLLLASASQTSVAESIKIATGEWPPFISERYPHYGIASDLVKQAFAEVDVEVEFGFFPWGRSDFLARKGNWDGLALQTEHPDFYNSRPVVEDSLVLFHLKTTSFHWQQPTDLRVYRLGGTVANTYGEKLSYLEETKQLKIERVVSESQNFNKLLSGRIDAVIIGKRFGQQLLKQHFSIKQQALITYHPKPIRQSLYRLSLSKANPTNEQLIERFNKGLEAIQQNGLFDKMWHAFEHGEYQPLPTNP